MTLNAETRLLAAIAYGESSSKDVYEEMAGIASVMLRQAKARGFATVSAFVGKVKSFTFVVKDGNERYGRLMKATEKEIEKDKVLSAAVKAAENAMSDGIDYSNGAYFWDGADIKSSYSTHFKVARGIHFTHEAHNIYKIKGSEGKFEIAITVERRVKGRMVLERKVLGTVSYQYESTAAYGGTIFWKFSDDYLKIKGGKEYI
ncbi:hypothetical protein [Cupriavidus oxalaticus]|uniref:hypothetical protein n=1 Tax=Cupriavidus oxalaticus TaxID=96344 RepID=UPI0031774DE6